MNLYEHILTVVDSLPEQFTVAMVRQALRERGLIEADIIVRQHINQLEAQELLTSMRPDGRHILYSVTQEIAV